MEQIELPPQLRVGQGYGKVSWAVRTLWESYVGWFRLASTTELYPTAPVAPWPSSPSPPGRRPSWTGPRPR